MVTTTSTKKQSKFGLVILAYIAFISLGLPDGLMGVAWPSIRANFGLPLDALGIFLIAGTIGYNTSSFFSGRLVTRLGVGGLLAASCAMTGAAMLGYTIAPVWWMMIIMNVMGGLGAGAIDAGINTYIASNHGERLMQWLHASFGVGITMGPLIMTTGLNLFGSWRLGYTLVGTAQIVLAACFALTVSLWKRPYRGQADSKQIMDYQTPLRETIRQRGTWLSILLFFFYTGIELTLGYWAYTLLTEARGIAPAIAGLWAGSYWGTFTVGRVLAGLYANRVSSYNLLRGSMLAALLGVLLLWWNPSQAVSLLGVALTGFAIAPIFPGLVSGTSARVTPPHAANTIGMQISAAGLGVMVLPSLAGVLARRTSLEVIPMFLAGLICILFLIYSLSMSGTKPQDD
ncbi:MAG: MFS transporter [Chloroflexota bacterium]|nr:MAG: MFS transporter [Chloroflexota bacterium]